MATHLYLSNLKQHDRGNIDIDILTGRTARDPHLNVNVEIAVMGGGGPTLPDTAR